MKDIKAEKSSIRDLEGKPGQSGIPDDASRNERAEKHDAYSEGHDRVTKPPDAGVQPPDGRADLRDEPEKSSGMISGINELQTIEEKHRRGDLPDFSSYTAEAGWAASLREKVGDEAVADAGMGRDPAKLEKIVNSTSLDPEAWKSLNESIGAYHDAADEAEKRIHSDAVCNTLDGIMNPYMITEESRGRIMDGIRNGDIGEREIRKIGEPLRERFNEVLSEGHNELAGLESRRKELVREQIFANDPGEIEAIRGKFDELRDRENDVRKSLTPAERMKTVLGEMRPMGPPENDSGQLYVNEANYESRFVIAAIDKARENLPTEWIEKSNGTAIHAKHVDRGYFIHEEDVSTIALSTGNGIHRCAYHELGHHFEDIFPEIKKLEHEFYNRRTSGEKLRWLGPGYELDEKTRYDKFVDPYIGKDYGNTEESGYELFSMGLEGLYCSSYEMQKDTEYQDFIFGILATVR